MALTSQVMYVFSVFLYFCIFCKMLVHLFLDISENQNVHIIWVWRIYDPWHFTDNVTSHKPYYRVGMLVNEYTWRPARKLSEQAIKIDKSVLEHYYCLLAVQYMFIASDGDGWLQFSHVLHPLRHTVPQKRDVDPMLFRCWASVVGGGSYL